MCALAFLLSATLSFDNKPIGKLIKRTIIFRYLSFDQRSQMFLFRFKYSHVLLIQNSGKIICVLSKNSNWGNREQTGSFSVLTVMLRPLSLAWVPCRRRPGCSVVGSRPWTFWRRCEYVQTGFRLENLLVQVHSLDFEACELPCQCPLCPTFWTTVFALDFRTVHVRS